MVYSLLSMLGTHDKDDMSRTLLAMSSSQDSCIATRQSGKRILVNALNLFLLNIQVSSDRQLKCVNNMFRGLFMIAVSNEILFIP